MSKDKQRSANRPAPLETILSLLGYTHLGKYGGEQNLKGMPLCYWLRCLTGKPRANPGHCPGTIPAPEVRYFSLAENGHLVQALLALCCFFDRTKPGERRKDGHTYPLVVKQTKSPCHEFLFLKIGEERVVLVDMVHLHRLGYLDFSCSTVNLVVVYLQGRYSCYAGRLPDSWFSISFFEEPGTRCVEQSKQVTARRIQVRRIVPVPANELLNGLFRLRKVNQTRQERGKKELPEDLRTMLIPFLDRQRKQLRRLPMHRARISEI